MKKIEKPVTVMKDVYVADDGTEWETQQECTKYEEGLSRKKVLDSIAHMKHAGQNFMLPMFYDFDEGENPYREWYKVQSQEELDRLTKIFKDDSSPISRPITAKQFPTYVYVEATDEMFTEDVYMEGLDESLDGIVHFLQFFGMGVEFKR